MRLLAPLALLLFATSASAQDPPGLGFAYRPTSEGLLVQALADDGPAGPAGLLVGDLVATAAGKDMGGLEPDAIASWLHLVSSGAFTVNLGVLRDGDTHEVEVLPLPYSREALGRKMALLGIDSPPPPPASAPRPTEPPGPSGDMCVSGTCTDGVGTMRYGSGQTFTGTFQGGNAVRGLLSMANGDTYDGEFNAEGKFHGRGTYTFGPEDEFGGHVFEGTFADGAPASGTYTWTSGQTYTGDWDGWVRTGRGVMVYTNGNRYEGAWHEGKRHGTGTFTWPSGATFTGDWVDNARVRGREDYESGDVYEGEYADDKRHGTGTMTYTSGNTYTGGWSEGKRHGEGVFAWTDGQRYEGTYKTDERSGQGTMTYNDGRVFTGSWDEGEAVQGTLLKPGESTPRPVRNEGGTFVYTD